MSEQVWGPWHIHDGGSPQHCSFNDMLEVVFRRPDPAIAPIGTVRIPADDEIHTDTKNWYWRWLSPPHNWWHRKPRLIQICDEPEYAPILRYRVLLSGRSQTAFDRLTAIADIADQAHIHAPEGPRIPIKETSWRQETDPRSTGHPHGFCRGLVSSSSCSAQLRLQVQRSGG